MSEKKRGKVWLGVAGLVVSKQGEWLVVKKRYSGLNGKWSLPAGFVKADETIDEAAIREVKEETGIDAMVHGMIGFRSGVINGEISDNMAIFLLKETKDEQPIEVQLSELFEARWMSPAELSIEEEASVMLKEMAAYVITEGFEVIEGIEPGDVFGYSSYKLYFKKK